MAMASAINNGERREPRLALGGKTYWPRRLRQAYYCLVGKKYSNEHIYGRDWCGLLSTYLDMVLAYDRQEPAVSYR